MLAAPAVALAAGAPTPEDALRALETAYVRKDLEAAVAAKDFNFEARAMLKELGHPGESDDSLVEQAAVVLELAYRKQLKVNGFPVFADLRCRVVGKKTLGPGVVEMAEECIFPDGGRTTQSVHAAKSASGWLIVVLH